MQHHVDEGDRHDGQWLRRLIHVHDYSWREVPSKARRRLCTRATRTVITRSMPLRSRAYAACADRACRVQAVRAKPPSATPLPPLPRCAARAYHRPAAAAPSSDADGHGPSVSREIGGFAGPSAGKFLAARVLRLIDSFLRLYDPRVEPVRLSHLRGADDHQKSRYTVRRPFAPPGP